MTGRKLVSLKQRTQRYKMSYSEQEIFKKLGDREEVTQETNTARFKLMAKMPAIRGVWVVVYRSPEPPFENNAYVTIYHDDTFTYDTVVEPYETFPSDAMIATIMLLMG